VSLNYRPFPTPGYLLREVERVNARLERERVVPTRKINWWMLACVAVCAAFWTFVIRCAL
jgi:cytochrome c oxidase assembly factor CtaG